MSRFDVSSFSMTEDIQIFKLVILLALSSSKLIFISVALDKSKWPYSFHFPDFGQITVILLSSDKTFGCEKQSKPTPYVKYFKNHP